jgi:hypothetical protein
MQDPQAQSGLVAFMKGWGTLIIASVALIQPWLIAIWKKAFRAGYVKAYETGPLEIGFSNLGPTLAIRGTARAVHRDHFIAKAEMTLTRHRDGARHLFQWQLFRSESFNLAGDSNMSLALATGFMLRAVEPTPYNILFHDSQVFAELRPVIAELQNAWREFEESSKKSSAVIKGSVPAESEPQQGNAIVAADGNGNLDITRSDFLRTKVAVNCYDRLLRGFYWERGKYGIELRVFSAKPDRTFTQSWEFELSEDEFQSLRLNAIVIMRLAIGDSGLYNFAYPEYVNTELQGKA